MRVARIAVFVAICWVGGSGVEPTAGASPDAMPRLVLWAWERPEDLMFLDPDRAAVAVLDRTIYLRANEVVVHRRQQPLRVQEGTTTLAVVRMEGLAAELSPAAHTRAVQLILEAIADPRVRALQIDFDALESQRPMYAALLADLRAAMPAWLPLSITALAGWCAEPAWLDTLPVDEAVPMAFRMGPDRDRLRSQLREGEPFAARKCRSSLGISTDEPLKAPLRGRRLYVFHPRPWDSTAVAVAWQLARD